MDYKTYKEKIEHELEEQLNNPWTAQSLATMHTLLQMAAFMKDLDIPDTEIDNIIRELEGYFEEYLDKRKIFKELKTAEAKTHMLLELKEFSRCYGEIFKQMWATSESLEERQVLQAVIPQLQQMK